MTPAFTAQFDHVALALERMTDAWPTFADALGGRYKDRGLTGGYSWLQLRFANGFVLETLHPESDGVAPPAGAGGAFMRRFLDRRGPGPHHFTFSVSDLDAAMGALEDLGLEAGPVDRHDPDWQEALYGADTAHGVILQLVQQAPHLEAQPDPPDGFPELGYDHPVASLSRGVHAVHDLEAAVRVFRDGLGGRVLSTGAAVDGNHWVELGWDSPGRLRLLEASHAAIAEWVGDWTGRVRHLYFTFDDPGSVPGAHKVAEARWAVDSDDSLGVRLVIASAAR